jgi:hypothetical protein
MMVRIPKAIVRKSTHEKILLELRRKGMNTKKRVHTAVDVSENGNMYFYGVSR